MSDESKPIAFQQAGNPANASQSVEPGTPSVPDALTPESVRKIAEEVAESKFRQAQGLIDKADSRITKKVQAELKSLEQTVAMQKAIGLEIPPEKVNQLQQQIIARAYTEPDASQPPAPSGMTPTQVNPQEPGLDPVTAAAYKLMQAKGMVIEDSDPEVAMIDQSDPYQFMISLDRAIDSKKARVAKATQPGTPTNAGSQGNPQGLEAQYKAELKVAAGKPAAVAQVKMKYRRLGLDIW